MKTTIVPTLTTQNRQSMSILDILAKHIIENQLQYINQGYLKIIDMSHVLEFGNKDDNLQATITVRSPGFYRSVAFGGSVGAGESYFLSEWDCDNLTNLVRILLANRSVLDSMDSSFNKLSAKFNQLLHWLNRNTFKGSRRNIAAHYDIGNDLFELMLDGSMMYSSAIYNDSHETLEKAAIHKLDVICQKLQLNSSDHLLEIGTGWGSMAIYAAKHYGCRVTTTTISQQQYDYALKMIQKENLEHKITLLFQDYRHLNGQFDKLVSIEMIEAVGQANLSTYFKQCAKLLKPDGLMCLQAITIADQRYEQANREVDFIQKYIFPGGSLPCVSAISKMIANHTDMTIFHLQDIGYDYARTLKDWRNRFFQNESQIRQLGYNDVFIRLWEFYLCYCEGGFLERSISTVQVLISKPQFKSLNNHKELS
jgi:cyclopropane-fatty-acyl-phospholipid synthase